MKSIFIAFSTAISLWSAPVLAAGTTPLSLVQQSDISGRPLAGCLLYFFVAGTVATPQNEFTDFGLTSAGPNPLTCDQSGRIPQHWLADGLIHIRLTDSVGVQIIDTTMQVLGPSSGGGGGGGTVDPTTILATGDVKYRYGTGTLSGFVRGNGLTIGNATCGCSERANADTQALFVYLYTTDPNLAVSGGRTGNALNDFNANKQLSLPDYRGSGLVGLADMGNSPTSIFTSTFAGCTPTVLGVACGNQSQTLSLAQLPTGITSNNATQAISTTFGAGNNVAVAQSSGGLGNGQPVSVTPGVNNVPFASSNISWVFLTSFSTVNSIGVTSNNTSGNPHSIVPPSRLGTIYIKL